jgi:hypothetical protein
VTGILHVGFHLRRLPSRERGGCSIGNLVRSEDESCSDVSKSASGAGDGLAAGTGSKSDRKTGFTLNSERIGSLGDLVAASSDARGVIWSSCCSLAVVPCDEEIAYWCIMDDK